MDTLHELFEDMLKDVYYAESAILKALPKMAKATKSKDLQAAFAAHVEETKGQIGRLDKIFALLGKKPVGKECHAIVGLIEEGAELIAENPAAGVLDAGLLGAAQAVEHYEITRYGTLTTWASELGKDAVGKLLATTLKEEKATDKKLSGLAEKKVNLKAVG